jgi:hypothetical protein
MFASLACLRAGIAQRRISDKKKRPRAAQLCDAVRRHRREIFPAII